MTSPSARLSRSPPGVRHLRVLGSTTFGPSCDSLGAIACDTDGPRVAASPAFGQVIKPYGLAACQCGRLSGIAASLPSYNRSLASGIARDPAQAATTCGAS